MSTVQPKTIRKANAVCEALEAKNISVDGVVFDPESGAFMIELVDGGTVGNKPPGRGDDKEIQPAGLGGGTVKDGG